MEKMLKKLLASALAIALLLTTLNITVFADDEPATVATETTEEPTAEPSEEPTVEKTEEPAAEPSEEPAVEKTEERATESTEEPAEEPAEEPVEEPAEEPTGEPVAAAASLDDPEPITTRSSQPDAQPSVDPTKCDHRLTWVDGETVHPTSCAERGYIIQRMKCQNCGEVISEWKEYQDEKIDHVFVEKQIQGECIGSKTVRICENCGKYETISDEEEYRQHDWVEKTAEVSCSDQSMGPVKWEECSRCGMRQNERYSLYTHTYNSGKKEVLAEATCTSSGWMRLTCDCRESTRIESTPKLGHAWDNEDGIEEAATCEHGTRKVRTCDNCGAKEVLSEENDRLEHQWKIDTDNCVEASCKQTGKMVEVCELCKKTRETIISRQHTGGLVGDSEEHWRVCSECKEEIAGTREPHHFTDEPVFVKGDKEQNKPDRWAIVCINCGYEKSYMKDHKHTWDWTSDKTNHWQVCTGCGTTKEKEEEWPHRWTWIDGDCTKGRKCSVCGWTDESAACEEHTFTAWTPDTVADNEGNQTHSRKCTVCGTIETEKHEYEWKTTRTPTPEQMGLEVGTCTQCGSQATRDLLKTEPTPTPGEITAGEATEAKPTEEPTPKPGVITPDEPTKEEPTTKPTEEPTPKPEITPSEPDEVTSGEPKKDEATSEPTEEPKPTPKPEITPSEPAQDESASEPAAAPAEEPTQAPAAPNAPEAPAAPAQSGARTAAALASKTVEELIASETVTVSESVTVALRPIADAVVAGDAPEGELVVRAAVVTDAQNAESDVYAAFAAAWQRDGELVAIEPVTVSIPVSVGEADGEGMSVPTEAFKLVRVDTVDGEETLTEIEFTFEGGMLTFEMDAAAVYLIIPA